MPVAKLKCKYCKKLEKREKITKTPYGKFCTKDHAYLFAQDKLNKDKVRKLTKLKQVRSREIKVNRKAFTELNRKTLKWQHKKTQPVFNKLRRLQELKWFIDRDLEPTCISCQKTLGNDQWCNGHFKTVGSNGRLRYDFKNSYLQHNHNCNKHKSGDIDGYKKGLVLRFGEKEALEIIGYCESNNSPIKRSWQDIEDLRVEFNKKIKGLTPNA